MIQEQQGIQCSLPSTTTATGCKQNIASFAQQHIWYGETIRSLSDELQVSIYLQHAFPLSTLISTDFIS